ncbi:MAG TPA: hypothetical protein VEZ11_04980 [Thermoanaerobaculia bacterium]|nr:hypothetical protein [Thermoanaerobaculia bacterium]
MPRKIGAVILLFGLSILTGCRFDQQRRNAAMSTLATAVLNTIFRLERATPLTQSTSRPAARPAGESQEAAETQPADVQPFEAQVAGNELTAPASEESRDIPRLVADCRAARAAAASGSSAGSSIDVIADEASARDAEDAADEDVINVPAKLSPTAVAPIAVPRRVTVQLAELSTVGIPELALNETKIATIVAEVSVHSGHKEAERVDKALREAYSQCRRVNEQLRVHARARAAAHNSIAIQVELPPEASL